jgi:hypothetical protein
MRCPPPAKPLFQAETADLNPWTEAKVDRKNPSGLALITSAEISTWADAAERERSGGIAGWASWQETWVMGLIQGRR